jgi:hypothetical protein
LYQQTFNFFSKVVREMTKAFLYILATWFLICQICTGPAVANSDAGSQIPIATSESAVGSSSVAKVTAQASDKTIPPDSPNPGAAIAAGTTVSMQNWRDFKQFMPEGMIALFEGTSSWKMPADVAMEVGPTVIHPLPEGYLAATEKHSPEVKLVELPGGGRTITGYQGGIPFPQPDEPHKGWKILANFWLRYMPHIVVNTPDNMGFNCTMDGFANVNCVKGLWVARQLSDNTDPGVPATIPGTEGIYYSTWYMVQEPEQDKYTTTLTIEYTDLSKDEDVYTFSPATRRAQRLSAAARCSSAGTDTTRDDGRFAFDSNIPDFDVNLIGEQKILAQMDVGSAGANFPADYMMPLGWPKPTWGKWELRDVYVLDIRKIPSKVPGYCYGKRIMYVDKQFYGALWEDLYDPKMQLWKAALLQPIVIKVPRVGLQNLTGAQFSHWWDLQHQHATFSGPNDGHGYNILINDDVPAQYLDLEKYTTPGGLTQVLR